MPAPRQRRPAVLEGGHLARLVWHPRLAGTREIGHLARLIRRETDVLETALAPGSGPPGWLLSSLACDVR